MKWTDQQLLQVVVNFPITCTSNSGVQLKGGRRTEGERERERELISIFQKIAVAYNKKKNIFKKETAPRGVMKDQTVNWRGALLNEDPSRLKPAQFSPFIFTRICLHSLNKRLNYIFLSLSLPLQKSKIIHLDARRKMTEYFFLAICKIHYGKKRKSELTLTNSFWVKFHGAASVISSLPKRLFYLYI